jgi:hypothetical protein
MDDTISNKLRPSMRYDPQSLITILSVLECETYVGHSLYFFFRLINNMVADAVNTANFAANELQLFIIWNPFKYATSSTWGARTQSGK